MRQPEECTCCLPSHHVLASLDLPPRALCWLGGVGFVSGSHDTTLRVWSASGEVLGVLIGHTALVYAVATSSSGLLASGAKGPDLMGMAVPGRRAAIMLLSQGVRRVRLCMPAGGLLWQTGLVGEQLLRRELGYHDGACHGLALSSACFGIWPVLSGGHGTYAGQLRGQGPGCPHPALSP